MKKAVVLVSGGLDSATALAMATAEGYQCYALSFDYGQRHHFELEAARQVAEQFKVAEHKIIHISLNDIGGSALTDNSIDVPNQPEEGIPVTYVPARNTVFLSLALGWAEVLGAQDIFIQKQELPIRAQPGWGSTQIEIPGIPFPKFLTISGDSVHQ